MEEQPKDMDNYAVRLLSGIGHDAEFGKLARDHLYKPRDNLYESFEVLGISDDIIKTVALFVRKLGLACQAVGRENVTPHAQGASGPDQSEIDALLRVNELDQELHAFGRARFAALFNDDQASSAQRPAGR